MKFLMVGLDGAAYSKVMKFNCPFLKDLCKDHQHGILRSDDKYGMSANNDPWTGPAWNTVYTGVNAKVHGVGTEDWASGNTAYLKSKVPTIFDKWNDKYTLGIMTMPALYPTGLPLDGINGWCVTGFPAEGEVMDNWKYPQDLELGKDFVIEYHHRCHTDEDFEDAKRQVSKKIRIALELFRKHDPEIGAIGIQYLDFVDHSTVTGMADPYEFIDKSLRGLFEAIKPDEFIICADHGFKMRDNYHSQEGFYVCSLPGEFRERSIFDMAPLALWITERYEKLKK